MDATPFEWFGTSKKYSLHGAIDDATGKVVGLYMTQNECLHGYFETTRQILNNFGIPVSIYADRHAIFLSQKASRLSIEDQLAGKVVNDTQFGRAMSELGITLISARSAQAKGRVERLWETLQSRLPIEFKIAGITTIDQANDFLTKYIDKFNAKFAVEPEDPQSAFRPITPNIVIDHILCVKVQRSIDNGGVFSLYSKHFKVLTDSSSPLLPPRARINVLCSPYLGVKAQFKNVVFDVLPYVKPKKKPAAPKKQPQERKPYSPPASHYYKYGQSLVKKLSYDETDREILQMLENIFLSKYA
jgi:hypothetical protein